jgi:hypothetical protein
MCFVWIWEQTAIISLYSINWLVFVTETECVYCEVLSDHTIYFFVLCVSENKPIISLYSINWLVFITETERVYCAVRAECLSVIQAYPILWLPVTPLELLSPWGSHPTHSLHLTSVRWEVAAVWGLQHKNKRHLLQTRPWTASAKLLSPPDPPMNSFRIRILSFSCGVEMMMQLMNATSAVW